MAVSFATTGFSGTVVETFSVGEQITAAAGASNNTVRTLGTLSTDGQQMKITLNLTAVDNTVDTNAIAFKFERSYYRASGTITAFTAFQDTHLAVGVSDFTTNVVFNVGVSGNNILLRLSNGSASEYTLNNAYLWVRQEGGFSA